MVAPGATGVAAFAALLESGVTAISAVDRFDTAGLSARRAAVVRDFKARDFIAPAKLRRMNMLSRYGLAAANLALADAGVEAAGLPGTGVALGTAFGPVQTSVDYMAEYVEKGPALASPQLFAESVANAPGSHIAIECGLRGFNLTVTQRESSALAAAMYGASQIVKGTVEVSVVGGVEELNEMSFSVLDRVGALAHEDAGGDGALRPFDRRRNGMLMGEGGAIFITGKAGSPRYGYFAGFGMARDTTASISNWGDDPRAVAAAMRDAIRDAELQPDDIDAVYASANGTIRGDRLEYLAIEQLFGQRRLPVVATKGYFGEYAAGGALQLLAALLAIRDQRLHSSCGFESADEAMHIDVTRSATDAPLRNILVNSLSAGGGIVCAVISREAS